jgi:hypothetical protein
MKHLKKFEILHDYFDEYYYKVYYGEDFINLKAILYKAGIPLNIIDRRVLIYIEENKSDYLYIVLRNNKTHFCSWMSGDENSLDWYRSQDDFMWGGVLKASEDEINKYKYENSMMKYNL